MHVINARNVNDAYRQGVSLLATFGETRDSRNGVVLEAPWPVATVYECPREHVLFNAKRDANPFFHLAEALWMLAGRNDVAALTPYVKRMETYSDDGGHTLRGAYGERWRSHFGVDQIDTIVKMLRSDPGTRQAVLTMFDPRVDLGVVSRDIPCNLTATFSLRRGVLDMTVFCRSNDMIWGAYGANAVHFSILQLYVSHLLSVPVGRYTQISNNFHAYMTEWNRVVDQSTYDARDPYSDPTMLVPALFPGGTLVELSVLLESAHIQHRDGDTAGAIARIASSEFSETDWGRAALAWLGRRL